MIWCRNLEVPMRWPGNMNDTGKSLLLGDDPGELLSRSIASLRIWDESDWSAARFRWDHRKTIKGLPYFVLVVYHIWSSELQNGEQRGFYRMGLRKGMMMMMPMNNHSWIQHRNCSTISDIALNFIEICKCSTMAVCSRIDSIVWLANVGEIEPFLVKTKKCEA